MRSPSCVRACPRSSSGPPAPDTTGRRSGCRCRRWTTTGRRWTPSFARSGASSVTRPPEGEGPGGERPFEGLPPEELEKSERQPGDLPDLEPEFIDALRDADDGDRQGEGPPQPQAQGKEPATQPETDERPETDEQRGTDEQPGAEEQRVAEPPTDATVEFTGAEAAAARGAQQDGEAGVSEDGAAEDE